MYCYDGIVYRILAVSGIMFLLGILCILFEKPWSDTFLLGLNEMTKLSFMGGDYALTLIRQCNQHPLMRLMEPNEVCVMESEIDIQYFAKQILAASSKIINHFPQHQGIRNIREIAELADALRNTLQAVNTQKEM